MSKSKRDYVSASQIKAFLFCPLYYRYLYVDEVNKMDVAEDSDEGFGSIYLIYGESFHAALEHNYRQKISSRKDLPVDDVVEVFKRQFFKGVKDAGLVASRMPKYANPSDMALTGENVLVKYMDEVAPTIQPLYVEHEFTIPLKTYNVVLHGYIDLIDENYIIRDHKTVGKGKLGDWTQSAVDENVQLTIYAAAFRKLFGRKEGGVCIDVIPRMSKPEFKSIVSQRSQDQVLSVLDLAERMGYVTEQDAFYANLGSCSECPYKNICPKRIKV